MATTGSQTEQDVFHAAQFKEVFEVHVAPLREQMAETERSRDALLLQAKSLQAQLDQLLSSPKSCGTQAASLQSQLDQLPSSPKSAAAAGAAAKKVKRHK